MEKRDMVATDMRAFVPAGDRYNEAIQFYIEMGFEIAWRSDSIALVKKDSFSFFLQNVPNNWAQDNFMMFMEVNDLDLWWKHLSALDLPEKYKGVRLKAPEIYPWGMREIHMIDPCGVLWHLAHPFE